MYKQIFNPDDIEKFSTKELNIVYNCIDCNLRLLHAYKALKIKHLELWYKLNHDDLLILSDAYYYSKKLHQKKIDLKIKKIVPEYTPEIMEMGQKLSKILLEKSMPLDFISKLVKNYIKICIKIKKEDSRMLKYFTPEMYIERIKDGTLVRD
jgi:L-fucose mutarotase/ribose pyranase (RbsD/FucU family)